MWNEGYEFVYWYMIIRKKYFLKNMMCNIEMRNQLKIPWLLFWNTLVDTKNLILKHLNLRCMIVTQFLLTNSHTVIEFIVFRKNFFLFLTFNNNLLLCKLFIGAIYIFASVQVLWTSIQSYTSWRRKQKNLNNRKFTNESFGSKNL